jgi:MFS family permease
MANQQSPGRAVKWLTPTVLGIGLGSLCSDLSHEAVTALLPAILASFGAAAAVLGTIEGLADGLSSAAKLFGGWWVDRLTRRKPLVIGGYTVMACGAALIATAASWPVVLVGRALSWIARGLRTPARKALLAEAVTPETYGRAFGFERTMDTVGAIGAPLIATALLAAGWPLHRVLWLAVAPAVGAALVFATCVRETPGHEPRPQPFWPMLRKLPGDFRRFLVIVGVFGAGDFAASLLTLYAIRSFAPGLGTTKAMALAVGLYAWRNVVAAAISYPVGWLADHMNKRALLAIGYGAGVAMTALLAFGVVGFLPLAAVFTLSGVCVGTEEVMEDAFTAGLLARETRGTGFGLLAAVNGAGDLVSSLAVGWLWAAFGPGVAFGYAGGLMFIGTLMIACSRRFGAAG